MKRILLLFCIICFCSTVFGQELVLTKTKNGKEKNVKQGKKIKVWTNTGDIYKGFFTIKNDSLLIPGEGTISINDIEMIGKKSMGLVIAGGALAGIGGFATFGMGIATVNILIDGGLALLALIVAIPMDAIAITVGTTGVIILTNGRKFKKTKWDYAIRNLHNSGHLNNNIHEVR